jgi:hypothetical protein
MEVNDDSIGPQLEDYEYQAAISIADRIQHSKTTEEILMLTEAYAAFNQTVLQRIATSAYLDQALGYDEGDYYE